MAAQGFAWTVVLIFCSPELLGMVSMETGLSLEVSGRVKRGWVWNQFFVVEEYTGTEPLYVGKSRFTLGRHDFQHDFQRRLRHGLSMNHRTIWGDLQHDFQDRRHSSGQENNN